MNILITGGNGFIGSHLVNALSDSGQHRVVVLDLYPHPYDALPSEVLFIQANLTDYSLLRRIIEDQGIEVVYHAAWATIHETSLKDPATDIHINLLPTVRLLEACRDTGVQRVIYISSGGTVYGFPQTLPIREDHPTDPVCPYGITKLAGEKYLQMYAYLYGLEYVILRPSVPFGPRQNPHRRQGVVTVFIYHALHGQPVTIWGDGENLRDYFYIEDLITALLAAQTVPFDDYPIFNLGGSQRYTLNQLVQEIEHTLGFNMKVRYNAPRKFDVPKLHLDCHKAAEQLGWQPRINLCDGIRRTAEWLKKWEK